MTVKLKLVSINLFILISNILSIDFFFTLDPHSHKCLGEYFTEHTTGIKDKTYKIMI
jgi:hypothetical protein